MEAKKQRIKVFCDTSVLIAAMHSSTGGSSTVLELAVLQRIEAFISADVVEEVHRNIPMILPLFQQMLNSIPFVFAATQVEDVARAGAYTPFKDAPIVAGATVGNVDYLVTLDKRHLLNNREEIEHHVHFKIITPGELLGIIREQISRK